MRIAGGVLLAAIALLGLACTSVATPSIPATTNPSVPPVDSPTAPPVDGPTGAPGTGFCALVTEAEMGAIIGSAMSVASNDSSGCTYTSAQVVPSIVIRSDSGESIATGKAITSNGRDLTIGGNRAYYGEFAGSLLYIEKGGRTLVVQAIWSLQGDEAVQKISAIGETAIARF